MVRTFLQSHTWHTCIAASLVLLFFGLMVMPVRAAPSVSPFIVDSNGDEPDDNTADSTCHTPVNTCTLRAALQQAAASGPGSTVHFNLGGGGIQTIAPPGGLPDVEAGVTIDGTTQPGCSSYPCIVLSGGQLHVTGNNAAIIGLCIINAGNQAILIDGAPDGVTIQRNYIGLNPDGKTPNAVSNHDGIVIGGATHTLIGGTAAQRNVISNSANVGVSIAYGASSTTVQGNYIGTDAKGKLSRPNNNGVAIGNASTNNLIEQNVISGNSTGVLILGSGTSGNTVSANIIGLNAKGTAALPNSTGIHIMQGASNNLIGGTGGKITRNVISGNLGTGIIIQDAGTIGNPVEGNYIGLKVDGKSGAGNDNGIAIGVNAMNNTVGGSTQAQSNRIWYNHSIGIDVVFDATQNIIRRNSIFGNGLLGIDLGQDGVTPNDTSDSDTGPNNLQNFPILTGATSATRIVKGKITNDLPETFTIDIYASPSCDPTKYGEGQKWLGATSASTVANSVGTFSVKVKAFSVGSFITATATDPNGNTSEFSKCRKAK